MKKTSPIIAITLAAFLLVSSLSGCITINLGPSQPSPSPMPTEILIPTATEAPAPVGLTEERLLNAEILSPLLQEQVKLVNGEFSGKIAETDLNVKVYPGVQFGDLNADGVDDAALILAENTGGTGNFYSLVVLYSMEGHFAQTQGEMIDDRPIIESLTIEDGKVKLHALVHAINDSMVDPTTRMHADYTLLEGQLVKTRLETAFGGGEMRIINIDSPVAGERASSSLRITGSMAIAPFENNLSLEIRDLQNNILFQDGFMVSSMDFGGPATFDNTVMLPVMPAGTPFLIVLSELSMMDGSPMVLNSVQLIAGE